MIVYRRSFVLSLALTLLVLVLVGCELGGEAQPAATTGAATSGPAATSTSAEVEATEAPAGNTVTPVPDVPQGGTLPIRVSTPITELRPWDLRSRGEEYAADLLYNGLVRLDPERQPQPDLAEGWEASPDGGMITFTLRSGLQWHDGTPLTGEDVTWTLNSLRAMTATNSLLTDLQSVVGGVSSPTTTTVVISLTQPHAPLLANLAVPILPRHRLEQRGLEELMGMNFWDEPIGSGPFKFVERTDQGVSFTRNDEYFRGRPHLEGVALVVAPDDTIAAQALGDGTLLLAEFPPTSTAVLTPTDLDAGLQRGAYLENGSYFLAFNVRAERVFSDTRVRQALANAVDVPDLVRAVTAGAGQPIVSSVISGSWAFPADLEPRTPDLDAARSLLDEAGWRLPENGDVRERNGITLTAQIFVRGDDPRRVAAAERIVAAAGEIGMHLEVAPADFQSVILAKLAPPYEFDLLLSSWVNAPNSSGFPTNRFYDPDDYALFGAENIWGGPSDVREGLRNIGGFSNPEYEQAALPARSAFDLEQRQEAITAAQQVIVREVPYLYLWADRIPVLMSGKVANAGAGMQLNTPGYLWDIERWYLAE
jgi:peptide/nickel transport system substrate-binding protein